MSLADITSTLLEAPTLAQVYKHVQPRPLSTPDCFAARFEQTVQRYGSSTAVIFEGKSRTWSELNEHANRYAAVLKETGLVRGDAVSLVMENRIEFLAALIAMNKLGLVAALINTNLTGRSLRHCISITDSRACIFGEERTAAIDEVRNDEALASLQHYFYVADAGTQACPEWAADLDALAADAPASNPPDTQQNTLADRALYVFTSGTTGLPKAAVISNRRFHISSVLSYKGGLKCTPKDRIYLCLPLYHGTGLFLGVGAAFATGASMFIRRRFSASNFLPEVREHNATCFVYIGELCRYLLNTPAQPDDPRNPLKKVMGNGLRPDIWMQFKQRYGISRVAEFYGSSEGNVGFINMLNKDFTVGTTSVPLALVEYDVDNDEIVRDAQGRCIEVPDGQPGLLLGKITEDTAFEGYSSTEETEKKILRNALEDGDAWFNTGDMMKTVDVGFSLGMKHYQFVDRVGDTFRWKSENVSTNEVGEIINAHPQINFCNVYGVAVPGADGKAGMAAITLAEGIDELDLQDFSRHVHEELPSYARPLFLRIQPELGTTVTFKMVKGDLRKEGYDPQQVSDPLYVLKPGSSVYEPLDQDFYTRVVAAQAGY
ncbi:MAG: long-chain-acyl-CoA synthetase [Gammaproteobacteria bacterium]|nr:long-chain-acyl-CoA synthetase [Gammaproteobacteria bacterium]